jgi:S-adenosylmethionine synthetase
LHPDKICDQISDAVVDACLKVDPYARVAVETMGGHGILTLTGEITMDERIDVAQVAGDAYRAMTYKDIGVQTNIVQQSDEISNKVDNGGAGDQGVMVGYACQDNPDFIPQELHLSRKLLENFKRDGKSQVVLDDGHLTSVVLSVQNESKEGLEAYVRKVLKSYGPIDSLYCNNIGSFSMGGFDADTGVTGRKIVVDAYGPRVPVGGGAFSGKDATKVDRSAAYMARWCALKLLHDSGADEVTVRLGYVIGSEYPLLQEACIDGRYQKIHEDCRPQAIIERFDLRTPIYQKTARYGAFGSGMFKWDRYDD